MTAQPARPLAVDDGRPSGLKAVSHIIAVSSCKGGTHPSLRASASLPWGAELPCTRDGSCEHLAGALSQSRMHRNPFRASPPGVFCVR